jgi:hypothetical protein
MTAPSRGRVYAIAAGVAFILLAFAYCAGSKHGSTAAIVGQIHAHRDTVLDTIRVVERRLVVDTQRVRVTQTVAVAKRAEFDSAAKAVTAVADTAPNAPISLALPALHVCQQAIDAGTVAYNAVVANLADMAASRDAEHAARMDDERELKVLKPPRFGFRSGLVTGIAIVAAAVILVR